MGQNEVSLKLETALKRDLFDEANVVYILSQVRKLFELNLDKKDNYTTLHFYCNWVLHPELNRVQTTKFLADKFSISSSFDIDSKQVTDKLMAAGDDFFKLKDLRKELREFLKTHSFSLRVTEKYWDEFRKSLLENVVDCPVFFTSGILYSMECKRERGNAYSYKFTHFVRSKRIPAIKLKFK